jgi:hypothetical protein
MIVVVTGSRTWTDESKIKHVMLDLTVEAEMKGEKLTLIHGNAPKGADRMCAKWAENFGAKVIPEPADWNKDGHFNKGAGFERNILMLEKYKPDFLVAFRAQGKSNGTDHCCKEARKRGIDVRTYY